MERKLRFEITSATLHILAMALMLCDHLWGTVVAGNDWMTCIGRISFPIFAFMIVEGYFHTKSLKKYVSRLLVFAIISEIPFNLMISGSFINPFQQNVLWTFLMAIGLIRLNEIVKEKRMWIRIAIAVLSLIFAVFPGMLAMADYGHGGILMVLVFYFFRGKTWWCCAAQLLCMLYLNTEVLGGFGYDISILGFDFFFPRQMFAILALIPIWLYSGKQGYHSKWLKYVYYTFYPAHLLLLGLIGYFM